MKIFGEEALIVVILVCVSVVFGRVKSAFTNWSSVFCEAGNDLPDSSDADKSFNELKEPENRHEEHEMKAVAICLALMVALVIGLLVGKLLDKI